MDLPRGLADATCVQSARADLLSLLETWRRYPLDDRVVSLVKQWIDESYPPAAAALARLELAPFGPAAGGADNLLTPDGGSGR